MRTLCFCILLFVLSWPAAADEQAPIAIAIHGGAGTILPSDMTAEEEAAYRAKLSEALKTGYAVLEDGGSSVDAVVATITVMENSPLFNAGKGAVFTADGKNELDASIMNGATLMAGAVAGVSHIKNPIQLARLVMEESPHVLLAREGAEAFARQHGVELVDADYFFTERRWEQLQQVKEELKAEQQANGTALNRVPQKSWALERLKLGTVGAVALDKNGNLAAGTSTGGMTNKLWGRVGDSPIIGAGTYAENDVCAISATGHGEYFIRNVVAYDICARVKYLGVPLNQAAAAVIYGKLVKKGGTGGVITMDGKGNIYMPFNTPGMYRGYINTDGDLHIAIYK
ncbi:MAG TPA: isoaspartyl peptidase/L-asparaginase [Gammaproteobacteria bacterium]|nr:isoaspartyl peptidase/L-asparaginase [Gammaproteobacteria bacterium]